MTQTNTNDNVVEAQGISLLRRHWAKVDEKAMKTGVISRSAAVRIIIDEWTRFTEEPCTADESNGDSR